MQVPRDLVECARQTPGLHLLVLHGSRVRDDANATSDWDFAYLVDAGCDVASLAAALSGVLRTDDVDLVDLGRASGLLRHRVAQEGRLVFERHAGEHERFVLRAVRFWLDAGPTIIQGQEAVLEGVG